MLIVDTYMSHFKGSYSIDSAPQLKIALLCVKWHHTFAVGHHVSLRHYLLSSVNFDIDSVKNNIYLKSDFAMLFIAVYNQ